MEPTSLSPDERAPLLLRPDQGTRHNTSGSHDTHLHRENHEDFLTSSNTHYDGDVESLVSSRPSKNERALHSATVLGERLPYNAYTTIDWLHDLVKDSVRHRLLRTTPGTLARLRLWWDAAESWIVATIIGLLTAFVAFLVDVSVVTVSDWKEGYCSRNVLLSRDGCCPGTNALQDENDCDVWRAWGESGGLVAYAVYVASAVVFGVVAGSVTLATKTALPSVDPDGTQAGSRHSDAGQLTRPTSGKTMYMAAGSGIPEIKTILSGFVIPGFLDFKVLVVKAVGATFAVATGMCLGKEGPFVHISTCAGYLVANCFPTFRDNARNMREMLSIACSAGLSVAFGAPIGGVLFSYEEISTYFPRRVLWRAFLCSLVAAAALKELNPMGTGKLVLFETNYGVDYDFTHYGIFVLLGVCGGIFGGIFCRANFLWSRAFRSIPLIKRNPVLELALVALATALVQYPNPLIRETGDIVMAELLVDCADTDSARRSWVCRQELRGDEDKTAYYVYLILGTLTKLLLTIITFGCKVPSGVIIPSLDAGALFGRLVGQAVPHVASGIFAMVGAAAFLAGVSRMTVSLAVIMFELTGEVNFVPPFMVAILTAKWVADAISAESVYDLAQHLLGHPFLDSDHALARVRDAQVEGDHLDVRVTIGGLIPPPSTMEEITLHTGPNYRVSRHILEEKLARLKDRGLMDAGLVLVNDRGICHGYLPEAELEFALPTEHGSGGQDSSNERDAEVDLLQGRLAEFIDRTPLTLYKEAPLEYAVEMFGKLGLRYLVIIEEDTAKVVGLVIKKRLVSYLEEL